MCVCLKVRETSALSESLGLESIHESIRVLGSRVHPRLHRILFGSTQENIENPGRQSGTVAWFPPSRLTFVSKSAFPNTVRLQMDARKHFESLCFPPTKDHKPVSGQTVEVWSGWGPPSDFDPKKADRVVHNIPAPRDVRATAAARRQARAAVARRPG